MKLLNAVKYDIILQFRHGFYYVYLFLALLYGIALRNFPTDIRNEISLFMIYTDPSALGFFFIGGIVMLEKKQQIMQSLFVSPFRPNDYIISKVVSLTILSLISCFLILFISFDLNFNPIWLFVSVSMSSVLFILIGFTLATYAKSINHYLVFSPVFIIPIMIPFIEFYGLTNTGILKFLPGYASLVLLSGMFDKLDINEIILSIICLSMWIFIVWIWTKKWFTKYTQLT